MALEHSETDDLSVEDGLHDPESATVLALETEQHGNPTAGPSTYSSSVPSAPPSPTVRTPVRTVPDQPAAGSNPLTRCRICLSTSHVRCPLIPDTGLLDRLLQVREQNYLAARQQRARQQPPVRILPTPPNRKATPASQYRPSVHLLETPPSAREEPVTVGPPDNRPHPMTDPGNAPEGL